MMVACRPIGKVVIDKERIVAVRFHIVCRYERGVVATDYFRVFARHIAVKSHFALHVDLSAFHAAHGEVEVNHHATVTRQSDVVFYPCFAHFGIARSHRPAAHGHEHDDHEQHTCAVPK